MTGSNQIERSRRTAIYIRFFGIPAADRPQYSILKNKVEAGLYQQILFSEFSRLDRKVVEKLIEAYEASVCCSRKSGQKFVRQFGKSGQIRYI